MNTIYDGSFVLGNTSATTYQAGAGISITQPSEGTVRISNDETVLWSGEADKGTSVSLSEDFHNFHIIKCDVQTSDGVNIRLIMQSYTDGIASNSDMVIGGIAQINMFQKGYTVKLYAADNTAKLLYGWEHSSNSSSAGYEISGKLRKVIGINRISGGNA